MTDIGQINDETNLDLAAIADECRQQAGDDIWRATDMMIERIKSDDPLYRQLHDPLTRGACYDWMKKAFAFAEQPSGPLPVVSAAEQAARSKARAEATRLTLEDVKAGRV
jgi:hypothetical protein